MYKVGNFIDLQEGVFILLLKRLTFIFVRVDNGRGINQMNVVVLGWVLSM